MATGVIKAVGNTTFRTVPFTIAVADWSGSPFTAEYVTAYVTDTSKEIVTFDASLRDYALDDIIMDKSSGGGGVTFQTARKPLGVISGTLYVIDANDGRIPVLLEDTVVPIANGGTGASSVANAQVALDMDSMIIMREYTTTYTCNSGAAIAIAANLFKDSNSQTLATPTGYTPIGLGGFNSGNTYIVTLSINPFATGDSNIVQIRNVHASTAATSKTYTIKILYAKSAFFATI